MRNRRLRWTNAPARPATRNNSAPIGHRRPHKLGDGVGPCAAAVCRTGIGARVRALELATGTIASTVRTTGLGSPAGPPLRGDFGAGASVGGIACVVGGTTAGDASATAGGIAFWAAGTGSGDDVCGAAATAGSATGVAGTAAAAGCACGDASGLGGAFAFLIASLTAAPTSSFTMPFTRPWPPDCAGWPFVAALPVCSFGVPVCAPAAAGQPTQLATSNMRIRFMRAPPEAAASPAF